MYKLAIEDPYDEPISSNNNNKPCLAYITRTKKDLIKRNPLAKICMEASCVLFKEWVID
jgi:hypothetical protein